MAPSATPPTTRAGSRSQPSPSSAGLRLAASRQSASPPAISDAVTIPGTLAASTRASFAVHNTTEDVDRLVAGLGRVKEVFA